MEGGATYLEPGASALVGAGYTQPNVNSIRSKVKSIKQIYSQQEKNKHPLWNVSVSDSRFRFSFGGDGEGGLLA